MNIGQGVNDNVQTKIEAKTDQTRTEVIIKINFLLPQIPLNTNRTIEDSGTAITKACHKLI